MPAETNQHSSSSAEAASGENKLQLTPEQVREVAEKVYALMLRDFKISRERCQIDPKSSRWKGGRA